MPRLLPPVGDEGRGSPACRGEAPHHGEPAQGAGARPGRGHCARPPMTAGLITTRLTPAASISFQQHVASDRIAASAPGGPGPRARDAQACRRSDVHSTVGDERAVAISGSWQRRELSGAAGGQRASGQMLARGAGAAGPSHSTLPFGVAPPCGCGCVTARRCRTRCRAGGTELDEDGGAVDAVVEGAVPRRTPPIPRSGSRRDAAAHSAIRMLRVAGPDAADIGREEIGEQRLLGRRG